MLGKQASLEYHGSESGYQCIVCSLLQKDPGFDRGQFHKQIAVMRGQVRQMSELTEPCLVWLSENTAGMPALFLH